MEQSHHSAELTPDATHRVAFIGLGRMGVPMAGQLVAAGFPVVAYDISEDARERAAQRGCIPESSVAAAVDGADVIVTMLPDERAIESLAFGEAGLVGMCQPGQIWIDMTSSLPAVTSRLAEAVRGAGADLVDAPVSGGVRGAEAGTLTIMVAGEAPALERVTPLLEAMGSRIVSVGEKAGAADLVKSLNNMLSAINLTAACEALSIALREGVDVRRLVDAVGTSTGASNALEVKVGAFALEGRFDSGFTIGQMLKDLRIALTTAGDGEVPADLAELTRDKWQRFAANGEQAADHVEVVRLILHDAGLTLPGPSQASASISESTSAATR